MGGRLKHEVDLYTSKYGMVSMISKQCLHMEYNNLQGQEIEMLFLLHPCLYKDKIVFKIQMTRQWYALYNCEPYSCTINQHAILWVTG